ncbi:hypothetical protein KEM54_000077 [Ascosphaera aggregata]|nr:hypothetical protein KEM54_000077 [Ascosphaera aggregata]
MSKSHAPVNPFTATEASVLVVGAPNASMVVGFPGIPETCPRVEGKVLIRPPSDSQPFMHLSMIKVHIRRTERRYLESGFKLSKVKEHDTRTKVGDQLLLWWCGKDRPYDEITAMDIPFRIMLPRQDDPTALPASICLKSPDLRTYYQIVVTVQYGPKLSREYVHPLPIVRYDRLMTLKEFNTPITSICGGDRSINRLETTLRKRAYGRGEVMKVDVVLSTKARAVTLTKLSYSVIEQYIWHCNGNSKLARPVVLVEGKDDTTMLVPEDGYLSSLQIRLPRAEPKHGDIPLISSEDEFGEVIPEHARMGFTTSSKLYDIKYYLEIKAHLPKLTLATKQEFDMCPLSRRTCRETRQVADAMSQEYFDPKDPNNPPLGQHTKVVKFSHHRRVLGVMGFEEVNGKLKKPSWHVISVAPNLGEQFIYYTRLFEVQGQIGPADQTKPPGTRSNYKTQK